eukprot:236266-Amphidinium_carterae.1
MVQTPNFPQFFPSSNIWGFGGFDRPTANMSICKQIAKLVVERNGLREKRASPADITKTSSEWSNVC